MIMKIVIKFLLVSLFKFLLSKKLKFNYIIFNIKHMQNFQNNGCVFMMKKNDIFFKKKYLNSMTVITVMVR